MTSNTLTIATPPSTWIFPGQDMQAVINAHPAGTEFLVQTGIHRFQSVVLRAGDSLRGEPGAIMSGARLLTEFSRESGYWMVPNQTQENPRHPDINPYGSEVCRSSTPECIFPEDLFFDDLPLQQVSSLAELGLGKWYFDYDDDKIYFYDNPAGHKVETSVTQTAITATSGHGIRITGLVIEKYANAAQISAVGLTNSNNIIIDNNEIRLNHGTGVIASGKDGQITNNHIYMQGFMGIGGYGSERVLIEGNEVSYNNHAGYWNGWSGGGMKIAGSKNATLRDNYVHHNINPGMWLDVNNIGALIENNTVEYNNYSGIFYEVSYNAIIRNNLVIGNNPNSMVYAGISIHSSPNVEVYGNTLEYNKNGIIGLQRDRGDGTYGPHILENLSVHDNILYMDNGVTGVKRQVGAVGTEVYESRNNLFEDNTYYLGPNSNYFTWNDTDISESEWKAYGHDLNGTFIRI